MPFCKVVDDWNTHSDSEDIQDDYAERLEEKTEEVIQKLQEGSIIWIGTEAVTVSDFTADLSIDDALFMEWLYEKGTLLKDKSKSSFEDWCGDVAKRVIESEGE